MKKGLGVSLLMFGLFGSSVLLGAVGVAQPDDKRTLAILANVSEEYRPQVAVVLEDQQNTLGSYCKLTRLDADEIWVLDQVSFYDNGLPSSGRWQVRYIATMCDTKMSRNVVFTAGRGATTGVKQGIAVEALVPGETLVDPVLGADVWKSLSMTAMKANPTCQNPTLKDTKVLEKPKTATSIWRELWTARACDRDMAQVVVFYPSKAGTLFRMAMPEKALPGTEKMAGKVGTPATPKYGGAAQ